MFFGLMIVNEQSQSVAQENIIASKESLFATPKDERLAKATADYRKNWHRMTGLNFSGMHWNQSVMVFLNRDPETYSFNHLEYLRRFEEDLDEEEDADLLKPFLFYKPGTVVVKENFFTVKDQPITPVTLTVMIKHDPGYDPPNGDWEYIQISAAGDTIVAGKADEPAIKGLCSDCHNNMQDRDYLFHTMYNR
jgi:hypothetical protein